MSVNFTANASAAAATSVSSSHRTSRRIAACARSSVGRSASMPRPLEGRQHDDDVDVGGGADPVLGGAAEQHDRLERLAERGARLLDELVQHARRPWRAGRRRRLRSAGSMAWVRILVAVPRTCERTSRRPFRPQGIATPRGLGVGWGAFGGPHVSTSHPFGRATIAAAAACALGAMSMLSAQAVEAPRPAPAKPAAPAPASQPAAPPSPPSARPAARPRGAGGDRGAEGRVREARAAERPAADPARRSQAADRPRQPVVPRRLEERAAAAQRLRAPLRAPDVPGLDARARRVPVADREDGREHPRGRRQRHDQQRPHQLLRDRAVGQPRDAALDRVATAWRRCSTRPIRRSSTTSATSSRTSAARASRTRPTAAPTRSSRRTSRRSATPTRGRSSAAWRT